MQRIYLACIGTLDVLVSSLVLGIMSQGAEQARTAAAGLKALGAPEFSVIYSSPCMRTLSTAHELANELGVKEVNIRALFCTITPLVHALILSFQSQALMLYHHKSCTTSIMNACSFRLQ